MSPTIVDFPGRDAVGRTYAIHDVESGREVRGTVFACWATRGPTWGVRLHECDDQGRPTVVHFYERAESKLGRWYATREIPLTKAERYASLVQARKRFDPRSLFKLSNPAHVNGGRYDSDEIGPWTRWAGDLDADLMIVGQDWGTVGYFRKNRGFDLPTNPTSIALAELVQSVGRRLPRIPTANDNGADGMARSCGTYLTNALLWLKEGTLSSKVDAAWFDQESATFLLEQIAIVQPRVIVALGQQAHNAILRACELQVYGGVFRTVVEDREGIRLPVFPGEPRMFGVYHCGARIRNTTRSREQQVADWSRVGRALNS